MIRLPHAGAMAGRLVLPRLALGVAAYDHGAPHSKLPPLARSPSGTLRCRLTGLDARSKRGDDVAVSVELTLADRLASRPLTAAERAVVLSIAAFTATACHIGGHGHARTALVAVAALVCARLAVRRGRCQPRLQQPRNVLPSRMSCLAKVAGLTVHYLRCQRRRGRREVYCFHDFGASSLSWARALQPLAERLDAEVIAFDSPGFGLTSRPIVPVTQTGLDTSPYAMAHSVEIFAGLRDLHVGQKQGSRKLVLLGHGLGAVSASLSALALPPREQARAALVLESPLFTETVDTPVDPISIWLLAMLVATLPCILRLLASSRALWIRGLRWLAAGAEPHERLISDYRWPCLVQGWDRGIACFVAARLHGRRGEACLVEQLRKASAGGLRVLVVLGEGDPVARQGAGERLAAALGASVVRLPGGHAPHESSSLVFAGKVSAFVANAQASLPNLGSCA